MALNVGERVIRGAEFLDFVKTDWAQLCPFDERLQLMAHGACVLSYVFGSYDKGLLFLNRMFLLTHKKPFDSADFGFGPRDRDTLSIFVEIRALEVAWKVAILGRRKEYSARKALLEKQANRQQTLWT